MKLTFTLAAMVIFFINAGAQDIFLRGFVTNTSGQPIEGATVSLDILNLSTTTADNGYYSLVNGNVSLDHSGTLAPEFSISRGELQIVPAAKRVSLEIRNLGGQLVFSGQPRPVSQRQGRYTVPALDKSGMFFLKLTADDRIFTSRLVALPGKRFLMTNVSGSFKSIYAEKAGQTPAVANNLQVTAAGFNSRSQSVEVLQSRQDFMLTKDFTGQKPNILFLYADQHQAASMGYEDHPDVMTPNFDKLVEKGVQFTRAYVQDAVCAPSRQSLMTGMFPRTIGVLNNGNNTDVLRGAVTMAETFKANGYETVTFGKRHLDQADKGWDIRVSHRDSEDRGASYVQWLVDEGINPSSGRPYIEDFAEDWAAEFGQGPPGGGQFDGDWKYPSAPLATRTTKLDAEHTMEGFTAMKTVDYIKNRNPDKPFFMWSTFYRPHQPYNPLPELLQRYDDRVPGWIDDWGTGLKNGGKIKKPANLEQDPATLPTMLRGWRGNPNTPWNLGQAADDHQIYRDYIGAYYALLTEMDDRVGEIIQALEDEGILDNTIILYTADHGEFVGRHGMVEKAQMGHSMYDDTYRVPLFFHWPEYILPDFKESSLAEVIDIYPTLMEFAGIAASTNTSLQGKSLVPALTAGQPTGKDYVVHENWSSITITSDEYKLCHWFSGAELKSGERDDSNFGDVLFDRSFDPGENAAVPLETINLYNDAAYNSVVSDLEAKLESWVDSVSSEGRDELFN